MRIARASFRRRAAHVTAHVTTIVLSNKSTILMHTYIHSIDNFLKGAFAI